MGRRGWGLLRRRGRRADRVEAYSRDNGHPSIRLVFLVHHGELRGVTCRLGIRDRDWPFHLEFP